MKFEFASPRLGSPARIKADARLVFDDGDGALAGLVLEGFVIWGNPDGTVSATFPSRSYKDGSGRKKFFWFLRARDRDNPEATFRFRQLVITAYERWVKG